MEVLAAFGTPCQGEFGGKRVLQGHKRGEVKRSGAGLESGGQSALKVSERPLSRVVNSK